MMQVMTTVVISESHTMPSRSRASATPAAGVPNSLAVTLRQRDELARGQLAGCRELLADGPIVFLGVKCTVFTDGILQEPVKDCTGRLIELAEPVSDRAGTRLVLGPDRPSLARREVRRHAFLELARYRAASGRADQCRKSPPRLTRSYATWYVPKMRQAALFRRLLTRAMFGQAFAESQAWTPIESPWTLPGRLVAPGLLSCCGRHRARLAGWLPARWLRRSHRAPCPRRARCRGRVGCLFGGALKDRLAQAIDPGILGLTSPQRLVSQMILVEQLRQEEPG